MKLFQLTVPNDVLKQIAKHIQDEMNVRNVVVIEAKGSSIISFRVHDEQMEGILMELRSMGVGVSFGFCDVMNLIPGTSLRRPDEGSRGSLRLSSVIKKTAAKSSRLTAGQIYANIEAQTQLSRDSMGLLLISAAIAGVGLAADSSTYVVASMLVSPLMGPLLGCSFGLVVRDRTLFTTGVMNELFALFVTLLLGAVLGFAFSPFAAELLWPTGEMRARGLLLEIFFGGVVAILSGVAVALAESNANLSSLVGTAIAAALLPPTVNTGMCLSHALLGPYVVAGDDTVDQELFLQIALGSALLVWVNVLFIYSAAAITFRFKKNRNFDLFRGISDSEWTDLPRAELKTPAPYADEISTDEYQWSNNDRAPMPMSPGSQRSSASPLGGTEEDERFADEDDVLRRRPKNPAPGGSLFR